MTRVLTVIALFLIAESATGAATEWAYVSPALGKSPSGANVKGTMEIDATSVVPVQKAIKAWYRLTYKADVANPVDATHPIRREKFLYYHLCEEHKRALIQVVYESAAGATIYTSPDASAAPKFEDVLHGTTGEAWMQAACKIATMKHKTSGHT